MLIDRRAKAVLKKLNKNGISAYIVGGAVRDFLLNKKPSDYDICYGAIPNDIKRLFKNHKIYETGIKYGTLTLNYKGLFIEITPFRTEQGYTDNRHPDKVKFVKNIEEDLSRRDFTINALALNCKGEILDLFGGKEDLKKGVIKAVGKAEERFVEDPLRILRAYRFASRFGFEIEAETNTAIYMQKKGLKSLSKERLSNELKLILSGENLKVCFNELIDTLSVLNIAKNLENMRVLALVTAIEEELKFPLFVALCSLKKALCLSNKEEKIIDNLTTANLAKNIDVLELFLTKTSEEISYILWYLEQENRLTEKDKKRCEFILKHRLQKQIKSLKINGNDLMNLGYKNAEITKAKGEISKQILLGNLKNNRKNILKFLKNKGYHCETL